MLSIAGYQLLEEIYRNPTSRVWRGIREGDHLPVVIKLACSQNPSSSEIATIDHEYFILKQLHLPGVVELLDFHQDDYYPALIFADKSHKSLSQYLNHQPVDLNHFFPIAIQLTQILALVHREHVIHKDIKPANILIDEHEHITLTDFSNATQFDTESEEEVNFEELSGTLAYMSPEQTGRMNRPIDYRTDMYSLGITFYEMLAGMPPFSSDKPLELIYSHIAKLAPLLSSVNSAIPEPLANIIAKLLAKDPEARYHNLESLKTDLETCYQQWQKTHAIADFEIAKNDIENKLHIPYKLYGREKEVVALLDLYKQTSEGKASFMFVTGYSGEGKTSLVNEVKKPITKQNGYFIHGKYDRLKRSTPLSAINEAFDQLIRHELTKPEDQLNEIKTTLLNALGANAKVLTDIMPMLEHIIGKQPPVPEVNPIEAQNRFLMLFQRFIQVFAKPENPLVIFLDDLQWADVASLNLIKNILSDKGIRYLFVIGAYRDNEVDAHHPLMAMVRDLEEVQVKPDTIHLEPLKLTNMTELLTDTLHLKSEEVKSLAELTFEKTRGNAFFIKYFLITLYQQKLLQYSHANKHWEWEINKIRELNITDNVVDLLLSNMHELSTESQEILSLASCIGFTFDLQTLKVVTGKNYKEIAKQLKTIVQKNLIIPMEDAIRILSLIETISLNVLDTLLAEKVNFHFGHDRIYQASSQLLSEERSQETHLKIANLLLKEKPLTEDDERVFDITNHFYQGANLIDSPEIKNNIAHYSLWAGLRAKASNAYQISLDYFTKGLEMLGENAWTKDYSLSFSLHRNRLDSLYLLVQTEQDDYFNDIIKHTKTNIEKSELYFMKIRTYNTMRKDKEAVVAAIEALKLFDFHLPSHVNQFQLILKIISLNSKLKKYKIEDIAKWGKAADGNTNTIVKLLASIGTSLYFVSQNLYAYTACLGIELIFTKGNSPDSSRLLVIYAMILVHTLQQYDLGLKVITATKYLESQYYQTHNETKNKLPLGMAEIWFASLINSGKDIEECAKENLELGDYEYASFAQVYLSWFLFAGIPLMKIKKLYEEATALQLRLKNLEYYDLNVFELLKYDYWVGTNNDKEGIHTGFTKTATLAAAPRIACCLFYGQFLHSIGDYQKASPVLEELMKKKAAATGTVFYYHGILYDGLILAKLYPEAKGFKRIYYYFKLKSILKQTQKWAKQYPPNFAFMYYWLAAEIKQYSASEKEVMTLYKQAAQAAKSSNFINYYAWINESAGAYLMSHHLDEWAKSYLQESYHAFQQWGAVALATRLADKYPEIFLTQTPHTIENSLQHSVSTTATATAIDFVAVLNANNAISREIGLTALLKKLVSLLTEYTGAQKAAILFKKKDQLHVVAQAEDKGEEAIQTKNMLLNELTNLPKAIIDYVQRSNEQIILNEPSQFEPFNQDPYIAKTQPKSLLCMPILQNNRAVCYIYLENRLSAHMFTPERLRVFEMLAGQIGISIENARLYESTSRFVPKPLMQILNKSSVLELDAGECVEKKITVMFTDIRHFTTLSERMSPDETFAFVNEFIVCMAPIIRQHKGFIVQYLGDAILSLFPNNADDAVKAALDMDIALYKFNQQQKKKNKPITRANHGINTGDAMVGILGEEERVDTNVMSDAINLASRIQGLNKIYHTITLVSDVTFESLYNPSQFDFRIIDKVRVKGRIQPTYLYEVLQALPTNEDNARKIRLQAFKQAFTHYEQNHFIEAAKLFADFVQANPDDKAAKILQVRCEKFVKEGAPTDWDGTYTLLKK